MTPDIAAQLRQILTPELLTAVHQQVLPCPDTAASGLFDRFYGSGGQDLSPKIHGLTFHSVFVPLSRIPLPLYPKSLLYLLPTPEDSKFPGQALGLILLLDQATRLIMKGYNKRWTAGFFDILALRLAQELDRLPKHLQPYERWPDFSWTDAMLRRTMFTLPFLHTDKDIPSRLRAQELTESIRKAAESHSRRRDPARTDPRASLEHEPAALPRLVGGKCLIPPPYYKRENVEDYFFFDCQTNRAHLPALVEFDRYPWLNAPLGRANTAKESSFLADIGDFAYIDAKIAADIRNDVEKDVWRPLESDTSKPLWV